MRERSSHQVCPGCHWCLVVGSALPQCSFLCHRRPTVSTVSTPGERVEFKGAKCECSSPKLDPYFSQFSTLCIGRQKDPLAMF